MKYMTKYISALLSLILCFVFTYPAMIKQVQEQIASALDKRKNKG